MRLNYEFGKSILIINKNLTKIIFLEKAGIKKDGYAKNMFSNMYDCIVSEIINLEELHQKYYSQEYESFEQFLYKKMYLNEDDIDEIIKYKEENKDYQIFSKDELSYGGINGLFQFTFSEEMAEIIVKILLLKN